MYILRVRERLKKFRTQQFFYRLEEILVDAVQGELDSIRLLKAIIHIPGFWPAFIHERPPFPIQNRDRNLPLHLFTRNHLNRKQIIGPVNIGFQGCLNPLSEIMGI